MSAVLIFLVLPLGLMALSRFIRPVERDRRMGDPLGAGLAAGGMFGGHGLEPDEQVMREETEPVRFRLD